MGSGTGWGITTDVDERKGGSPLVSSLTGFPTETWLDGALQPGGGRPSNGVCPNRQELRIRTSGHVRTHPDMKQSIAAQRAKRRFPSSSKGFRLSGVTEEMEIRTSSGHWQEQFEECE